MQHLLKQENDACPEPPLAAGSGGEEGVLEEDLVNALLRAPKGTQDNPVQLSDAEDDEREANAERESRSQAVGRKRVRPLEMGRRLRARTGQKSVRVHKEMRYESNSTSADSDDTEQEFDEGYNQSRAAQGWEGDMPFQNGIGQGVRHMEEEVAESTGEAADAAHQDEDEQSGDEMDEMDEDEDEEEEEEEEEEDMAQGEDGDDDDDDVVILNHVLEEEGDHDDSSSDVEVVEMEDEGEVRRRWEEAAQRRRASKNNVQNDAKASQYSDWAENRRKSGLAAGDTLLNVFAPLVEQPKEYDILFRSNPGGEPVISAQAGREHNDGSREAGPSDENVNAGGTQAEESLGKRAKIGRTPEEYLGERVKTGCCEEAVTTRVVPPVQPQGETLPDEDGSTLPNAEGSAGNDHAGMVGPSSAEVEANLEGGVASVACETNGAWEDRLGAMDGADKCEGGQELPDVGLQGDVDGWGELNEGEGDQLIGDREKMKLSDDFQKADEEEWRRRQEELQRQALAAQIEKRRRRKELEMNARTQQRLEEVRAQQATEEMQLAARENMKSQVHSELLGLIKGCTDLGTVLHRLGIPVENWPNPAEGQVEKAFRKAQLKFHPDRASASKGLDPREQVHAEETFKLITKLKMQLPLIPKIVFMHHPFKGFRSPFGL